MPLVYSFTVALTTGRFEECEGDLRDIDHWSHLVENYHENSEESLKYAIRQYLYDNPWSIGGFLNALSILGFEDNLMNIHKRLNSEYDEQAKNDVEDESDEFKQWIDDNIDDLVNLYYNFAQENFRWFKYSCIVINK